MLRILFFLVLIPVLFIVGIFYFIAKAFSGIVFGADTKAWRNLLERLRAQLRAQKTWLVPWDGEMLSLLSLNRQEIKRPGFFGGFNSGVFTTIYQEPVLAYVKVRQGKTAVLLARTSDREFVIRQKEKETEIWLNSQPLGILANGALLAPGKGGRLLARLEASPEESLFPIVLQEKTAAALGNPDRATGPNPRVMSLIRPLSAEEENLVMALVLTKLVV